ncbi:hypothetical protein COHA_009711 [Chlorella ohadii]|uniref:ABC transporter domain-containing protein n=1 Tax=Chlorella ohadii TaxID=2649997 RepID=A0AAD5DGJ5_9CHLO|nr:hypothetical protein COHA_009711 [Chlorella ohadii]
MPVPGKTTSQAALAELNPSVNLMIGAVGMDLDVLAPLPESKRVAIDIRHVSAHVPLVAAAHKQQGGGVAAALKRLLPSPAALGRRIASQAALLKGGSSKMSGSHRQVLFDVSGSVQPGEVLALMGPSGSGKTTLLTICGGRAQKLLRVEGSAEFNGQPLTKALKRRDDLLHEALTVHETLYYAAMLRLPRHMSHEDKLRRVEVVTTALGLHTCQDTIIGGFFRKGVSGGERKRTSIAVELLIDPSVLLLGHAIYYGQAAMAAAWFGSLGYSLPFGSSLADFILDLASGDVGTQDRDGEASRVHLIEAAEAFLAQHPQEGYCGQQHSGAAATAADEGFKTVQLSPIEAPDSSVGLGVERVEGKTASASLADAAAGGKEAAQGEHRWGAPWSTQVALLFRRSLRTRRFQSMSTQDIVQAAVISLLAGLCWWQAGQDDTVLGARNTLGLLFFLVMLLSFRALYNSLFTFPEEFKHMLKERASGMYRLSAFYFARIGSDLPMDFLLPSIQIVVIYWMGGLRRNAWAFLGQYGVSLLAMLVAQLLGCLTMNPKTAQTVASIVMLTMVLTGGFFALQLPAWISWLKWISYIFFSLQTAPGCSPIDNIQGSLGLLQDPASQGDAVRNTFVLLGMLVFFRIMIYLVLRRRTSSV